MERESRRDEWERSRNGMTEIKASRRDRERRERHSRALEGDWV